MANNKNFKDDKHTSLKDDISKIQQRPEMYVGTGLEGVMQLTREATNNAIDECTNPNSCGRKIEIIYDDGELTVSDDGRGIDSSVIMDLLTVLNSSSKFYRDNGDSAGENGCGFKAIVALSDYCVVISERPSEKIKVEFDKGKTKGPRIKDANDGRTGLSVRFKPSHIFFGNYDIDYNMYELWLSKISYLIKDSIKIKYKRYVNGEMQKKLSLENKTGIIGLLQDYVMPKDATIISKPIALYNAVDVIECVVLRLDCDEGKQGDMVEKKRKFKLSVGFAFTDTPDYEDDSFCNFINTTERGLHIEGVKAGLIDFFKKETKKTINNRDSKELSISDKDVERGLCVVINVLTDLNPQFTGQIKGRVSNPDFYAMCKKLTKESLDDYFIKNPNELRTICSYIKTNAKARLAANKARKSVIKEEKDKLLSEYGNRNLIPANNKGKNQYREILFVEGDSAAGGRYDNDSQAIFLLRGYPKNPMGVTLDKFLDNMEIRNLVTALKTNIGARFDADKCYYQKIILMPDADADGSGIFTLLLCLFVVYMPELIKRGMVYKATPPLYSIKDKNKRIFVNSKQEYYELFNNRISANIKLRHLDTNKVLSHEEMLALIIANRNYMTYRQKIVKGGVHPDLVDFLAYHFYKNSTDKQLNSALKKEFNELSFTDSLICGVHDGRYQFVLLDTVLQKKLKPLMKIIEDCDGEFYFDVEDTSTNTKMGRMSIGQILSYSQRYIPIIYQRYKGLGELDDEELKDTTLNPHNRLLYRITMEDGEKALNLYNTLHGQTLKDRESRKKIYTQISIDPDLLDN